MQGYADLSLFGGDPGYVLTALLVCIATGAIVVELIDRSGLLSGARRIAWTALLIAVAGLGVWTTHFVAMLGWRPDLHLGYDPATTIGSAIGGMVCVGAPLAIGVARSGRSVRAVWGALSGLGVGAMHFLGMAALQGCVLTFNPVANAFGLCVAAACFAAFLAGKGRLPRPTRVVLIVTGVCTLHFSAMAGVTLVSTDGVVAWAASRLTLSFMIVLGFLVLFAGAFAAAGASRRVERWKGVLAGERERHNQLVAAALHNMSNGVLMLGPDRRVQLFNSRVQEIFGLSPESIRVGMPLIEYLTNGGRQLGWTASRIERVHENHLIWMSRAVTTCVEHQMEDGRTIRVNCRPLPGGGGVICYDDVTDHRAAQAALEHMAHHDALTGLGNRRGFWETMAQRLAQAGPFPLLLLDLDRFKAVNDTFGHQLGDALLVAVAARLRATCREGDGIFRLGGDELAVLPACVADEDEATALGGRIVAALAEPFIVDDHRISIGCSVGLARSEPQEEPQHLLQRADLALYRAKELGRGRVEPYAIGMIEHAAERRQMELDLARAIAAAEFELWYQPIVQMPGRRLVGFEALVRWRRANGVLVPPGEFVPLAEETGLIAGLGAWALDAACREAAGWPPEIHVAVNLSPVQMRRGDVLALVTEALSRCGLDPRRLELELTETAIVNDGARIARTLKALRRLGVRIAMDDFGTGFSSLAHLRDFELDIIKIDRSFVDTDAEDIGGRAVVRAITGMARDLSILTIGEGVETEEQFARLAALGVDRAQGYLLGRPMPADEARRLIALQAFDDDARADAAPPPPSTGVA